MMKIMLEQWDKNEGLLKRKLSELKEFPENYLDLVKLAFDTVYNSDLKNDSYALDCSKITAIDNGHYCGTLLFLTPFAMYEPSEYEYLMTYVGYGSCCGCDALQHIESMGEYGEAPTEWQQKELLNLCRDILSNTIKPYNCGWRSEECFNQVEYERSEA